MLTVLSTQIDTLFHCEKLRYTVSSFLPDECNFETQLSSTAGNTRTHIPRMCNRRYMGICPYSLRTSFWHRLWLLRTSYMHYLKKKASKILYDKPPASSTDTMQAAFRSASEMRREWKRDERPKCPHGKQNTSRDSVQPISQIKLPFYTIVSTLIFLCVANLNLKSWITEIIRLKIHNVLF